MGLNKKEIFQIRNRLQSKQNQPSTEEATKQWLVIPFLVALGYDQYSSDIVPEYTLDIGVKKGEKVDYALQINSQPVAIIECKQLNVSLSKNHISQLYRYFTVSDVHVAILTNGDDYWFFTDSERENIMDTEPYYKVRLSESNDADIDKLNMYSKELIQYTDMSKIVKYEKFQKDCKDILEGLRYNNIPTWLIDVLIERSGGLADFSKSTLAEYMYTEAKKVFKFRNTGQKEEQTSLEKKSSSNNNEDKKSNIQLNHEYTFNDYSDGDWKFHKIGYVIIFGRRYDNISGRQMLITTLETMLSRQCVGIETLLEDEQFKGTYKIGRGKGENIRGAYYIEDYDIFITTSYGIDGIITFMTRLCDHAQVSYDNISISFKE